MTTDLHSSAERYRNWGKWGEHDQVGTLNYITPDKIVKAARLVRKGLVFSLAIDFNQNGPQSGRARVNPVLSMRSTGADFVSGSRQNPSGFGGADDHLFMSLQAATHWDALSHIFDRNQMWNGYNANNVNSLGAKLNGVENIRAKIVTRAVLLDLPRFKGVERLADGYAITEADIIACLDKQEVAVGTGDILLIRTGQLGYCKQHGWGAFAGGDAPGLSFSTAGWLHRTQLAGVASDTWGVEVRPNELPNSYQPLHQVMIPNMGLLVGEMFDLDALAADCASDHIYDCLFVAPPLPITGAVGSPVNPQAIK